MKIFNKQSFAFLLVFLCLASILQAEPASRNIVIFGDSQANYKVQKELVQTILNFHPFLIFKVGDNVDNGNDPRLWQTFDQINQPLFKTAEYFSALGNHEQESPWFFKSFPAVKNRSWYSVERAGIHFIVLDSNLSLKPDSPQYKWLKSELISIKSGIKFKIALFHHPLFDVGIHPADTQGIKSDLLPLFKQYGVSAVFSGHDHNYQRFFYQNMFFIVTGGGGSPLYPQLKTSPYLQKFKQIYHFCVLSPQADSIKVRVIDYRGNPVDTFVIALPPEPAGNR